MNYKRKLLRRLAANKPNPGTVTVINVRHDKWCQIFKNGECNCDPDIEKQHRGA